MGVASVRAAALIVLGAGIAAPWPQEYRGALVAGAVAVLLYLLRYDRTPPDDPGAL